MNCLSCCCPTLFSQSPVRDPLLSDDQVPQSGSKRRARHAAQPRLVTRNPSDSQARRVAQAASDVFMVFIPFIHEGEVRFRPEDSDVLRSPDLTMYLTADMIIQTMQGEDGQESAVVPLRFKLGDPPHDKRIVDEVMRVGKAFNILERDLGLGSEE